MGYTKDGSDAQAEEKEPCQHHSCSHWVLMRLHLTRDTERDRLKQQPNAFARYPSPPFLAGPHWQVQIVRMEYFGDSPKCGDSYSQSATMTSQLIFFWLFGLEDLTEALDPGMRPKYCLTYMKEKFQKLSLFKSQLKTRLSPVRICKRKRLAGALIRDRVNGLRFASVHRLAKSFLGFLFLFWDFIH